MVFIVSDQRIATENFEKGKIYKVVFLDESIFYGVCLGIGSNFVMLSGNISGYLFPLTMETASQVESIDLFDPTPPEPPVPWTNLLQYQTGSPPFTFNTTDDQLFSWYITGAGVGDKTANLFSSVWEQGSINGTTGINQNNDNIVRTADYIPVEYNALYSMSRDKSSGYMNLRLYDANKNYLGVGTNEYISVIVGTSATNPMGTGISFCVFKSISENVAYIRINDATNDLSTRYMMIEGEYTAQTMPSYEPYGQYKIPILCNEHLTNIYLDTPLEDGEILYSTDIDTNIITDIGNNILSVETTQQPSEMQIVYKIADR